MKRLSSIIVWIVFIIYILIMCYLLIFSKGLRVSYMPYWECIKTGINLVPFKTVKEYIDIFSEAPRVTVVYLAGHILAFVPLGVFLPCVWRKYRKYKSFVFMAILIIFVIETTQLFTTFGVLDIDDFISNLLGATLGFAIWRLKPINKLLDRLNFNL